MRILHTSDIHLGQILYQYYDRVDEHARFFKQLEDWVMEYKPDALVVSGDVFDVAQPSASVWKIFTKAFVTLRHKCPGMHIVITAGNHDSASRLQAHSDIWALADTTVIGTPPSPNLTVDSSESEDYIIKLPQGYIIAMPYVTGIKIETFSILQDYVARLNTDNLPVVMTAHLTASGADLQGHNFDIGNVRNIDLPKLGCCYDYLALGHIHRPQTLNHQEDCYSEEVEYPAPVARYCGSPLHVSCDETYPHSVSLVDIDKHGGPVKIRQLRIDQLRHFKVLPENESSFESENEAFKAIKKYIKYGTENCYLRLRFKDSVILAPDFNNKIYSLLEESGKDLRYNPKHIRVSDVSDDETIHSSSREIELETLTQMENPLDFVRLNLEKFNDLTFDEIKAAFQEIESEIETSKENPK